jgi:leucyl-tRNA synthetase
MDFKAIESKWQKFWEEHSELYRADDESDKEKKYILVEFPYPSGSGLHVGHAFSFTGSDVYARFKRMQGYNVLFPMGWDAFGLPTENYAIKMKRKPQEITKENTDIFRSQMKKLAFSFDWSREINTSDPNYYKWTKRVWHIKKRCRLIGVRAVKLVWQMRKWWTENARDAEQRWRGELSHNG